jgi:uncharacterized protein
MTVPRKLIPSLEGWFTMPPEEPYLLGSRCQSCGNIYFPRTDACRNPRCPKDKAVEDIKFGKCGKVFTFTVNYYKPPPPYHAPEPYVPFASGIVELPEGVMVQAMIGTGFTERDLKVGMDVELVVDRLYTDDEGNDIMSWMYHSVKKD